MTGFIAAITGPTGAGKSTVTQELAKHLSNAVNIDVDQVKHFIVSDFRYEDGDSGIDQWRLLGKNIGMLAKNFHDDGYDVIINGYLRQSSWEEMSRHIEFTHKILLLPDVETVLKRDKGRNHDDQMGDQAVKDHHAFFSSEQYSDFQKINSADQTIDETVREIMNLLSVSVAE